MVTYTFPQPFTQCPITAVTSWQDGKDASAFVNCSTPTTTTVGIACIAGYVLLIAIGKWN